MTSAITTSHFGDQDFLLLRGMVFLQLLYQHVSDKDLPPHFTDQVLIMLDTALDIVGEARASNERLQDGFRTLEIEKCGAIA